MHGHWLLLLLLLVAVHARCNRSLLLESGRQVLLLVLAWVVLVVRPHGSWLLLQNHCQ